MIVYPFLSFWYVATKFPHVFNRRRLVIQRLNERGILFYLAKVGKVRCGAFDIIKVNLTFPIRVE
jgi:hypothetical protein